MKSLTLLIKRTPRPLDGSRHQPYWQAFTVSVPEQAYVLDALEEACRQDSSLMIRHSCHHASCGSCGIRIDGREALACITPAFDEARGEALRLEPLRNFPVMADLVVDLGRFAQKMEAVRAPVTIQDDAATRFSNCIECGLCISACPISAINNHYLGPAVLAASRHNLQLSEVRAAVESIDGVWRCHGAYECTDVCPADVDPASAIGHLRMELILTLFKKKGD